MSSMRGRALPAGATRLARFKAPAMEVAAEGLETGVSNPQPGGFCDIVTPNLEGRNERL